MEHLKSAIIALLSHILPASFKDSLLHLSFHLARPEFDRFAYQYNFAPNMEFGLSALAAQGFSPPTIIDVGAFEGNWTALAHKIWPNSHVIMFEANHQKEPNLSRCASAIGAALHFEVLGARDGEEVAFSVMESGSSVLSERSPLERHIENRRTRRLDSIVTNLVGPALLKIDTQGYELEVLKGCLAIVPHIDAIILEVAIIEINEGAPLLDEVLVFLKGIGFVTFDIVELHRRPLDKALNQIDILFVREDSTLLADKRHFA